MYVRRKVELRIIELLRQKGGSATDKEVYESLRREFGLSQQEFHKILMYLELEGFISVRPQYRDSKVISLKRY